MKRAATLLLITAAAFRAADADHLERLPGRFGQFTLLRAQADNAKNVNQLAVAWTYETGDDTAYTFSPIVIDISPISQRKAGSPRRR